MASASIHLQAQELSSAFDRVTDPATLTGAWAHVRRAAMTSPSRLVRAEARRFEENAPVRIAQIAEELAADRFTFAPARGVAVTRPGKRPRPIVVAPIPSRVVSRALLDVLQGDARVRAAFLATPSSFGGLPGRGVEHAIAAAQAAVAGGAAFYLRSDIAEFFRAIPRTRAIAEIGKVLPDDRLLRLLDEGTRTELLNLADLGDSAALFPGERAGVAQGGSLSTLLGNALLRGFDGTMNGRGIVCLRYVDDLLVLGPRPAHVKKAWKSAERILSSLDLSAYDPERDPEKAAQGHVAGGVEWLGCEIIKGRARPSLKSRRALLARVDAILTESDRTVGGATGAIASVEELLEGFRGAYGFCAAPDLFAALDAQIGRRLERYFRESRPRLTGPGIAKSKRSDPTGTTLPGAG